MTKEVQEGFVIKFDYNLEALQEIVKEANAIDFTNLELVKETHKKLVKIRTTIKKQEKEMVDEANSFRNRVFGKRDEYLSLTEPVEAKLKTALDMEEQRLVMEARISLLPNKKEQLAILDIRPVTDEEILALDDEQWVAFYQSKMIENQTNVTMKERAKKIEEERVEREARIKKEMEEKAEQEKKELIERAEKEKQQAILKAENDKKIALEKAEREQKEAVERVQREAQAKVEKEKRDKETKEKAEAEAKAKMEADKQYQDFLKANDYDATTDKIVRDGAEVKVYRLVATLTLFKK